MIHIKFNRALRRWMLYTNITTCVAIKASITQMRVIIRSHDTETLGKPMQLIPVSVVCAQNWFLYFIVIFWWTASALV